MGMDKGRRMTKLENSLLEGETWEQFVERKSKTMNKFKECEFWLNMADTSIEICLKHGIQTLEGFYYESALRQLRKARLSLTGVWQG